MSWTPCPICGSPLVGYAGSRCTNPRCGLGPEDPWPFPFPKPDADAMTETQEGA